MNVVDNMYRYLKSREPVNATAGALADFIKKNRGIDAVVFNIDDAERIKDILDYAELSYCMAKIEDKLLLMYSSEDRHKYMSVYDHIAMGKTLITYRGLTHSEAEALKDLLDASGIKYHIELDNDWKLKVSTSKDNAPVIEQAVNTIKEEGQTLYGKEYFISNNVCWIHALHEVSKAINYEGVTFIGSEAGTYGVRVDNDGAIIISKNKENEYISRDDIHFQKKLVQAVLKDLNGERLPVKVLSGDFAKVATSDIADNPYKKPVSLNEALRILKLKSVPDFNEIGMMINNLKNYNKIEREALYSIIRMKTCRELKVQGLKKISKENRMKYMEIHQDNIRLFKDIQQQMEQRGQKDER